MSKMSKQIILFLVLIVCVSLSVEAGNTSRIGTAGAQELLIPVGARGIALGNANVSMATGIDALYWNPAGISRTDRNSEVIFSHMKSVGDINVEYGALGINAGSFGTLGFSLKSLSFGDIPVTTEEFPDGTGELYSPTYVTLGVTYSKLLSDRISVGATFNLISEKIMSTSASGVGLNVGVQYFGLGVQGLNLGIAVKNIGPQMKYDGSNLYRQADLVEGDRPAQLYKVDAAAFELPSVLEIGMGYQRKIADVHSLSILGSFQNNNYQEDEYKLGAEYGFDNMLFLRGGYQFSANSERKDLAVTDSNLKNDYIYDYTFGVGVNYDLGGTMIAVDYAYRHQKYMDANNVVTVRLGF